VVFILRPLRWTRFPAIVVWPLVSSRHSKSGGVTAMVQLTLQGRGISCQVASNLRAEGFRFHRDHAAAKNYESLFNASSRHPNGFVLEARLLRVKDLNCCALPPPSLIALSPLISDH
jgi:hypothetical protein